MIGHAASIAAGEWITASGEWVNDHTHGQQFKARFIRTSAPTSIDGIEKYLGSGMIRGIGFKTADAIAMTLGIEQTALIRVRAGISYALTEAMDDGHCGLPTADLVPLAEALLDVGADFIHTALDLELAEGTVMTDRVGETACVFLASLYRAEQAIAERLRALSRASLPWGSIDADKAVPWIEQRIGLDLAPSQKTAVRLALASKVLVITGGPGVGKTTIVNAILRILAAKTVKLLLCAPTGRAAKRLTEATGQPAKTIHRLLEVDPKGGGFKRNVEHPLDCDLLVVDETSMVDVMLMHALLKAVPVSAELLVVGDVDQLPSVGPGQILADLIASGAVPVVRLAEVFRQAAQSRIITSAHRINQGSLPDLGKPEGDSDFYFVQADDPDTAVPRIIELVKTRIPQRFGLDPIRDIQVLCPMNRGGVGARSLNIELQKALNPVGERKVERFGWTFAPGDKVMQIENDYDKDGTHVGRGQEQVVPASLCHARASPRHAGTWLSSNSERSRGTTDEALIPPGRDGTYTVGGMFAAWDGRSADGRADERDEPVLHREHAAVRRAPFDRIDEGHFMPAFERGMAEHLDEVEAIANASEPPTVENTLVALERSGRLLDRVATTFFNLTSANTNDTMETIRGEIAPRLAAHRDQIFLHGALFARVKTLYEQRDNLDIDTESRRLIEKYHTDFVRAGAELAESQKTRMQESSAELAALRTTFSQNVLSEVNEAATVVDTPEELAGLSEDQIAAAIEAATAGDLQEQYVIAMLNTSGQPVLSSLENRELRERIMRTSLARGSRGGEFDNREVISRMARLRAERAVLLGYPNHAAYVLEEETAGSVGAVNDRLASLVPPAVANARREATDLQTIAAADKLDLELAPWDWSYYTEKVRAARYDFDASELRPYFEMDNVLQNGVFFAANRLYGLSFEERPNVPVYHPDVRVWEVFDADGSPLGLFLTDY